MGRRRRDYCCTKVCRWALGVDTALWQYSIQVTGTSDPVDYLRRYGFHSYSTRLGLVSISERATFAVKQKHCSELGPVQVQISG